MTGAGHTAEFQREERYIVIKRKNLSEAQERDLRAGMKLRGIGTVECVVVESDWPEYETVWKMIEARVTGHAVSAAEGDLLGKALEALRALDKMIQFADQDDDGRAIIDLRWPEIAAARAILSQAQAREVTR